MNIGLLFKGFIVSVSLLFGSCFDTGSSHECTPAELEGLRLKIEARVQEMREKTDALWGDGFFDSLSSGAVDMETFIRMDEDEIQTLLQGAESDK